MLGTNQLAAHVRSHHHRLLAPIPDRCYRYLPLAKPFDVLTSSPLIAYQPEAIWHARRAFFDEGKEAVGHIGDAVLRSWRRCNDQGHRVQDAVEFAPVERSALQLLMERNRRLLEVAQPELGSLARSVSQAGYATLLTDAHGRALAVDGAIAAHGKPLRHAFRAGVDLSEAAIGTNAMSVAMSEQQPVSVCGPEHYFSDIQVFHCCAAPVFDPQGQVIGSVDVSHDMPGMLRSALWLASRCAQRVERRLFQGLPSFLHLEIDVDEGFTNADGASTQAWLAFDDEGRLVAASRAARQLMGLPSELVGFAFSELFDARFGSWLSQLNAASSQGLPLQLRGGVRLRAQAMAGTVRAPSAMSFVTPLAAIAAESRPAATPAVRAKVAPSFGDERLSRAFEQARRALHARLPVLLTGETGTGKDITACALHDTSAQAAGPFVALNCAAIPTELLSGELFGHVDGAYTGSRRGGAIGKIEAAHGGTLFLDEIGDMPLALQAALLRVLDSHEVVRLGDTKPRPVDVRIVCATHRDLAHCVAAGGFREDLFYRVAGHVMALAPLRERMNFDEVLDALLRQADTPAARVPEQVRERLRGAPWPGNVRQLSHALRRALALAEPGVLLAWSDFTPDGQSVEPAARMPSPGPVPMDASLLRTAQNQVIAAALQASGGNVTQAARRLGIGRATLYRKVKALKAEGRTPE